MPRIYHKAHKKFEAEIDEIKAITDKKNSPVAAIPGIGINMAAMIIAEIGDFDKISAFSWLSPSTCQSGQPYIGKA